MHIFTLLRGRKIGHSLPSLLITAILSLLLAVLFVHVVYRASDTTPSFDGAMNLQVAASIAEGDGFRRSYADHHSFPHEIQTGAPYLLPAAAVLKISGIGILQTEIVNIAYFILLLAVVYFLVKQRGGGAIALFAACTIAVIPGMQRFGFAGYGEIPALSLFFLAVAIFYRDTQPRTLATTIATGILLALAVITKTVMLIGAGAFGACFILQLLLIRDDHRRFGFKQLVAIAASAFATLTAMEIWRGTALGGFRAWTKWWSAESGDILKQAGVRAGFASPEHGLLAKLEVHLAYLAHFYNWATWITTIWLLLLCAAAVATLVGRPNNAMKWGTLTVLVAAVLYMSWWLLITPTAKAWHRRIIDGMICADVGVLMLAAAWFTDQHKMRASGLAKYGTLFATLILMILPITSVVMGLKVLAHWKSPHNSSLLDTARQADNLPHNAYIFGVGWYSAPRIGLFSGRNILDFNRTPVPRINKDRPVYFAQEAVNPPGVLQHIRSMYGMSAAKKHSYALIRASSLTPLPLTPGKSRVRRNISAADNYTYMRGFNQSEGANGRWLSSDNLILLTPQQGDLFRLVVDALPPSAYLFNQPPRVIVSFNGCAAPPESSSSGNMTMTFRIPDRCNITFGKPVNVRIEIDNLVNTSIARDPRPLSIKAVSLGFYSGKFNSQAQHPAN